MPVFIKIKTPGHDATSPAIPNPSLSLNTYNTVQQTNYFSWPNVCVLILTWEKQPTRMFTSGFLFCSVNSDNLKRTQG